MNHFIYNEDTRIHTLDGRVIPSVTQVIAPLSDFSMIPPKVLERKCELGKEFHKAIELYMLDDLVMDSLDPDIVKPMETFIEWWEQERNKNIFVVAEKPYCHLTLKYCGKPDIVMMNGVYDIKLRLYNKTTDPLQMVSYEHLLHNEIDRFGDKFKRVLSFDIKGKLKIHDARNSQAWPMFQAMLKQWKDTQKFNELLKTWKENN